MQINTPTVTSIAAQEVIDFSAGNTAAHGAARTVSFLGREFRVIPAVLIRSQVLHNNLGNSYLPADEITAEWAAQWNGIPVLVGPHPSMRGQAVSGRTPSIMDARCAGWIFNAKAESEGGGVRKLVGEVWLDVARATTVPGLQEVLAQVDAGGIVELSTGFPINSSEQHGEFRGEMYDIVMRPTGADHLVVSVDMIGACSIEHGCGLGVHALADLDLAALQQFAEGGTAPATNAVNVARRPAYTGVETTMWQAPQLADFVGGLGLSGATMVSRLNHEERRKVANHSLLGDPNATTLDGMACCPVVNPRTGKLNARALRAVLAGRGTGHALPLRARDSAQIMARRLLREEFTGATNTLRALAGVAVRVTNAMRLFGGSRGTGAPQVQQVFNENTKLQLARDEEARNTTPASDQEHANMLREALQNKLGGYDRTVVVADVYREERQIVFWFSTPLGPQPSGSEYFQVEYAEGAELGAFTFSDPARVRRMTVYEPAAAGAATMSRGAAATPATNNKPCGCQEEVMPLSNEDKAGLVSDVVAAMASHLAPITQKLGELEAKIGETATAAANTAVASFTSTVETLKGDLAALSTAVNAERDVERQDLVQQLSANGRTPFTTAELEAKPVGELRKLAEMAKLTVVNYGGRGGPRSTNVAANSDEPQFMEPVPYFKKPAAAAAAGAE